MIKWVALVYNVSLFCRPFVGAMCGAEGDGRFSRDSGLTLVID